MTVMKKIALALSSALVAAASFGSVASADSWNWQNNNNNNWGQGVRCDVVVQNGDSRSTWSRSDWDNNDSSFRNGHKEVCVIRPDGSRHVFNCWGDQWDDHWSSNWNNSRPD
jgi:hypothetical protein